MINIENISIFPKWSKEIIRFLGVKSQFILWGNIYDIYPIKKEDKIITLKLNDYIKEILVEENYKLILTYEPLYGFSLLLGDRVLLKEITGESVKENESLSMSLPKSLEFIEKLLNNDKVYATVIINFSSRLAEIAPNDINEFYYKLFRLSHNLNAKLIREEQSTERQYPKYNLLMWTLDKENDMPAWYTIDNVKSKSLSIPKPDYEMRKHIITNTSKNILEFNELDENKKLENQNLFIDQTANLFASEILSIISLARKENIVFSQIGEAIKRYKLGIIENQWAKLDTNKIQNSYDIINERVKGQKNAIIKATDIIKRAVYNLSGSQYSKFSQRPKGVLFFAGPTGVGKTELAKSVTQLLFGSENSYIRFDMSEFSHDHSDQRLVGAPPGYVGYDLGGELTNAIKQNPFSVILFDEIEKAHPKILDIFLQILDDGRLTSGRGETVYFSESLIIFTSNLGIYEVTSTGEKRERVNATMPLEEIESTLKEAIEDYFKYKIGRPEILNRIGENIVVFDFIRTEVAREIFAKMLNNVLHKLVDTYKINIEIGDSFKETLFEACCSDISMGGRGIGNKLEEVLVNPLSRELFRIGAKENNNYKLIDLLVEDGSWKIQMESI